MKHTIYKIAVTALVASLLLGMIASAAGIEMEITKDPASGTMTVVASSVNNDIVTLMVLPEGLTPEDIERDPSLGSQTVYVRNEIAGENGKATFQFPIDSGAYTLYAASSKTDANYYEQAFHYLDNQSYAALIQELKSESKSDFTDTVQQESNRSSLGFDLDIYSPEAVGRLYDMYKNALSDTDYKSNQNRFRECALIEALNHNTKVDAKSITNHIKKLYADDETLCEYIDTFVTGKGQEGYFADRLRSTSANAIKDSADLKKTVKEALILTVVKNPTEAADIQEIMYEYRDTLGLKSLSGYMSVYRSLAQNDYKTASALLTAYKEAVETATGGGSGSGGGGTGGGSGSGSGTKVTPSTGSITGSVGMPSDTAGQTQNMQVFDDIDSVPWAEEAIVGLYKAGVVNGKSERLFYPNDNVLREEFAKMLVATFDFKLVGEEVPFTDVPQDAWYYTYVKTAYLAEAVNGIGGNLFGTGRNITRQDLCVMTYRMLRVCDVTLPATTEARDFLDEAQIADYAKEAVSALQTAGIVNGNDQGYFNPQATATRAETAKIMYGILGLLKRG